jgi:hypothetical protein
MDKTLSDVLEYLYKNDQKELAEVVLKELDVKRNNAPNLHRPSVPPRPTANPSYIGGNDRPAKL